MVETILYVFAYYNNAWNSSLRILSMRHIKRSTFYTLYNKKYCTTVASWKKCIITTAYALHIREKVPHSEMHVFILCINLSIQTTTPLFIMCYILTQNLRYIDQNGSWKGCTFVSIYYTLLRGMIASRNSKLKANRFSWSSWYPLVWFYHVLQHVVYNRDVTTKISGMSIKCYTHTDSQIIKFISLDSKNNFSWPIEYLWRWNKKYIISGNNKLVVANILVLKYLV